MFVKMEADPMSLDFVSFLLKNPQNLLDVITHSPNLEEEDDATDKPPNA